MVFAKTSKAASRLSEQIRVKSFIQTYLKNGNKERKNNLPFFISKFTLLRQPGPLQNLRIL